MKKIHVAKKATASEIRGSVGVTSTHNRSAAKAIKEARAKTTANGHFVEARKVSKSTLRSKTTKHK